jgi:hypothetical protein
LSPTAFLGGLLAGAFAAALAFNYHPSFHRRTHLSKNEKSAHRRNIKGQIRAEEQIEAKGQGFNKKAQTRLWQ